MTDEEAETQIAAHRLHAAAPVPVWPIALKMGFNLAETILVHAHCKKDCVDVKVVIWVDTATICCFLVIGKCPHCGTYVWDHKSIDADHRVLSYSQGKVVSEGRLIELPGKES